MTKAMSLENGKYTIYLYDDGSVKVERYREEWRDFTGDKFIFLLVSKFMELVENTENKYLVVTLPISKDVIK